MRYTTMLPWRGLFPLRGELRAWRAWCPACYRDWLAAQLPVYEPLLWAFHGVRVCLVHRAPLISRCPHCHGRIPMVPRFTSPATCPTCHASLAADGNLTTPPHPGVPRAPSGDNGAWQSFLNPVVYTHDREAGGAVDTAPWGAPDDEMAPEGRVASDEWVASELGALLAAMPKMAGDPTPESAGRWLQHAQYARYQYNTPALCAAALLAEYVGYECITGTKRHHLAIWLRFFAQLQDAPDRHLAQLAFGPPHEDHNVEAVWSVLASARGRRYVRDADADGSTTTLTQDDREDDREDALDEIHATLDALVRLDAAPIPPIVTIAYWVGRTLSELQTRWPEQYAILAHRGATAMNS